MMVAYILSTRYQVYVKLHTFWYLETGFKLLVTVPSYLLPYLDVRYTWVQC